MPRNDSDDENDSCCLVGTPLIDLIPGEFVDTIDSYPVSILKSKLLIVHFICELLLKRMPSFL